MDSITQPDVTVATPDVSVTTVTRPIDHFSEFLYTLIIVMLLSFVIFMGHVHNDSLASKGMDFVYLILGALTQASTGGPRRA